MLNTNLLEIDILNSLKICIYFCFANYKNFNVEIATTA